MKKLLTVFLAAATMLLCAAQAAPLPAEDPAGDISVVDAYASTTEDDYGVFDFHVPKIDREGAGIDAVNGAIWEDVYPYVAEYEDATQFGYSPTTRSITYEWYVNGDVLSICVTVASDMNDLHDYYVYNLSLTEGERIADYQLLQAAGVTREEFNSRLQTALAARFDEMWGGMTDAMGEEFVNAQRDSTLASDSVRLAVPYLGADGVLYAVARIYSLAGAEYYWHILALS